MKQIASFFVFVVALAALAGCSTTPSASELPQCGPRPTVAQARLAVRNFIDKAYGNPLPIPVRNIRIGQAGKLYRGLLGGGGYLYGWWIEFDDNVPNAFGGYTGYCRTTIIWNARAGIHWNADARKCY